MAFPAHRTSFARRMLLLFLLCIVAPGIFFGYESLRRVETKFHEDTLRRMRFQVREVAMSIHAGFASVEEHVVFLASALGSNVLRDPRSLPYSAWFSGNRSLLGVSRIHEGRRTESLYGNPCPPPPGGRRALAHLVSGNGLLYTGKGPGGQERFFLAHAVPGISPERELLACEVNPEYVWERARNAIPPVSEIVVLSPDGGNLFQSRPVPSGFVESVLQARGTEVAGNFEWGRDSEALLVSHAAVFLKPAFFSEDWTVALTQSRSEAFAAADHFTRVLFLTITLVVLVAGLFALVQVRRSTAPLAVLEEGTRRISGGNFDSRIEIGSGDEFEELARSFNAMAGHLGKEFRTQAELGRLVQAILGETDRERIVRSLLDNVNSVIPCDCAGVSLLGIREGEHAAVSCILGEPSACAPGTGGAAMFLHPDEIDRLKSSETSVVAKPGGEFDRFLSLWPGPRPSTFLLSPLVSQGELTGVVLLGRMNGPDPAPETLVRLRQIADQTAIALSRADLVEELNENDLGTLQALSRAVDTNSSWTAGHSLRVTALAMEIGWDLGLSERDIDVLQRGGLLHDIGKLGIPASILDKPGRLTEEEFVVIKRHPSSGAEILRPIPTLERIVPIVSQHHERFDGTGYPLGLSGDAISRHARILAVADVVDAVSSNRPYRSGWPREKVLAFVHENSGVQFDPVVVESFLRVAAKRTGGFLTDIPWSARGEHPQNPLPRDPIPAGRLARAAREAPFSGYSEPYLRG